MGFGKTHTYYKYFCIKRYKIYLYSLWVLPKPINYTNIFVVFMGFDHLYRLEVTHICITKGFQLFIVPGDFGFLYPLWVLALSFYICCGFWHIV